MVHQGVTKQDTKQSTRSQMAQCEHVVFSLRITCFDASVIEHVYCSYYDEIPRLNHPGFCGGVCCLRGARGWRNVGQRRNSTGARKACNCTHHPLSRTINPFHPCLPEPESIFEAPAFETTFFDNMSTVMALCQICRQLGSLGRCEKRLKHGKN